MPTVMKIIGFADLRPCPFTGWYLLESTPYEDVKGTFTPDLDKALRMTKEQAFRTWNYAIGVRPDGKPDRPLTCFTVELLEVDDKADEGYPATAPSSPSPLPASTPAPTSDAEQPDLPENPFVERTVE